MLGQTNTPDNELHVIVRFTNKTDFDFTPAMGAMYGGQPFTVLAGKSMLAQKPVALHLAKHLARQTFIKKAPIRDASETDGKGTDRALWTEDQVLSRAAQFISEQYAEEKEAPRSEAEIIAAKVAELNKSFPTNEPPKPDDNPTGYTDKQQVIAELEKRGIRHDKRQSKDKLEQLLK